jgi:hemerythrin-like domain-containing protein
LSTSQPQTLADVNHIHEELSELFHQHQKALLQGDYRLARRLMSRYEESALAHMKEEEDILLPLYRQRASPIQGGDPEFFIQEHQKILEFLNRLKFRLSRLTPSLDCKDMIALLDDEAHFKKYVEHHTLREDRVLYPEVERIISEKEKTAIMRLMTFTLPPPLVEKPSQEKD